MLGIESGGIIMRAIAWSVDLDPKDQLHKYLGPHSVFQPCRLDSVTGQVAQKSSHVKVMSPETRVKYPKKWSHIARILSGEMREEEQLFF